MRYFTPEFRALGHFADLTKGQGGSCPDGAGQNNTQLGGGANAGGSVECGPGTGGSG